MIKINEDTPAVTNTVGSGTIAKTEPPISMVTRKRKLEKVYNLLKQKKEDG